MQEFLLSKRLCFPIYHFSILILGLLPSSGHSQTLNLDWVQGAHMASNSEPRQMEIDQEGNIIVTGSFSDSMDINYGIGNNYVYSNGYRDGYIEKFDSEGNLLWYFQLAGTSTDIINPLFIDDSNNVFYAGIFSDTVDLDLGPGIDIHISEYSYASYISKIDKDGNYLWSKVLGDEYGGVGISHFQFDDNGKLYLFGGFSDTCDFDFGPGEYKMNSDWASDVFISVYDSVFNRLWTKQLGNNYVPYSFGLIVDDTGNVYLASSYRGTIDIDPGPLVENIMSSANQSGLLIKLDSLGDLRWYIDKGVAGNTWPSDLKMDSAGDLYWTGFYQDTTLTVVKYLEKIDPAGNSVWNNDYAEVSSTPKIRLTNDNNLLLFNDFRGTVDFDPGTGTLMYSSVSPWNDLYIQKHDLNGNMIWTNFMAGPDTEFSEAFALGPYGELYCLGTFTSIVDFDPGPAVVNLTAPPPKYYAYLAKYLDCVHSHDTISVNSCSVYTSPSGTYVWDSSGTYLDTVIKAGGCDSVLTIQLAINIPTDTVSISLCFGEYYTVGGSSYSSSGTYVDTIISIATCDTIRTSNVVVQTSIDTSVTNSLNTLLANQNGAQYQWLDCDLGMAALLNDTSQILAPLSSGTFAVEVTSNGCIDTSDCHYNDGVYIIEHFESKFKIMPNPSSGLFRIISHDPSPIGQVSVYDQLGKLILQQNNLNHEVTIDLGNTSPGLYNLYILNNEKYYSTKIIVK